MALRDIETFLRERAALYDPNIDLSPGGPFDKLVIQPLLRRLGPDPFTVDIATFLKDRMAQAFPDLATSEADAIPDLLIKPATVIWDPIPRETKRIANISFRDPSTMTKDEADSLGANIFAPRKHGKLSRGPVRIYFSSPQNASVTPTNFLNSKGGLHFFPTEAQSIRLQEMVLNLTTDGRYFFDINAVAEKTGSQYNIGPNEISSIANMPAVIGVNNLRRFGGGEDEQDVETYVGELDQSLSERSLVTIRGIAAKLSDSFPEITRLNVVGFNDPEMQRDIIEGGGLGPIIASGVHGVAVADGESKTLTRRFSVSDTVDFIALISGDPTSWVLTVFQAFGTTPLALDLKIKRIVSSTELDVEDQKFMYSPDERVWTLRKSELTLSHIPGGIIFPDSANGTVAVPDGKVHIGGTTDVYVRGTDFDQSTLSVDNVTDDKPLFKGSELLISTGPIITLQDMVLNGTYLDGDDTFIQLENAAFFGYTLQILDGVDAGNYRILSVTQVSGQSPVLTVDPAPTNPGVTTYRWRLFDAINIDLLSPKETRIEGEDLRTVQGTNIVDTSSGINFNDYGVSKDDTLKIIDGPDAGEFTITADPLAPSFDKLSLSRALTQSKSDLQYTIFRPNSGGGIQLPLVRLTKIEILDTSNQPIGSTIPYAKPVDIQTRAFQNSTRGVKHDIRDARLGLVSDKADFFGNFTIPPTGVVMAFKVGDAHPSVTLSPGPMTVAAVVAAINSQIESSIGVSQFAIQLSNERFGIRPVDADVALIDGSNLSAIFGNNEYRSVRDIRSDEIDLIGWDALSPQIDTVSGLDVVQVLDGNNAGFYEAPYFIDLNVSSMFPFMDPSTALVISNADGFNGFAPEIVKRVQIGARSIGSARAYFLEPTSFEVDAKSRFTVETSAGELTYLPDPTLAYQRIPALPSGEVPADGVSTAGGNTFTSASQDFVRSAIRPGDNLEIENHPIAGDVVLANPVVGLVNKTIIFSLDGGPDRTLTFIRDSSTLNPTEVSRDGVITQINAAAGEKICSLTGTNTIEFDTPRDLVIRAVGTSNSIILGNIITTVPLQSFSTADRTNLSPHAGKYKILTLVGTDGVTVEPNFVATITPFISPVTRQTFKVTRQGVQRITATSMANQVAEVGLYYFDVELVSLGTGDQWNIDRGLQMTASIYRSDGYYLTTDDSNLSFSSAERPGLVLSRSILENGVDDDPKNATQISGQNIQITYDRAPLVGNLQNFLSSEIERVVCSSPLGRHLIPHFVRLDVRYAGGSKESVIVPEVEKFIRNLFSQDPLESSDLQRIFTNRGADSIQNPIDLIAVVHYPDRTVYIARSQNSLTTGRLAAFIPDRLDIKRTIT